MGKKSLPKLNITIIWTILKRVNKQKRKVNRSDCQEANKLTQILVFSYLIHFRKKKKVILYHCILKNRNQDLTFFLINFELY